MRVQRVLMPDNGAESWTAERVAVLRLVGDQYQLGSVSGGGAFRLLAQELGAAEMLDVLRFTDPE